MIGCSFFFPICIFIDYSVNYGPISKFFCLLEYASKLIPFSSKLDSDDRIHEKFRGLFKNYWYLYSDFGIFSILSSNCIQKVSFGGVELMMKTIDAHWDSSTMSISGTASKCLDQDRQITRTKLTSMKMMNMVSQNCFDIEAGRYRTELRIKTTEGSRVQVHESCRKVHSVVKQI